MTGYAGEWSAIKTRFSAAFAALQPSVRIDYPDAPLNPKPQPTDTWVRLSVLSDPSDIVGRTGGAQSLYRHPGMIQIQVFAPLSSTLQAHKAVSDDAMSVFRAWEDSATRIVCRAPYVSEAMTPPGEAWRMVSIAVPFRRDELF